MTILTFVVLGFSSCDTIVFEESQPKGVKLRQNMSDKWIGTYINEENDTLVIMADSFSLTGFEDGKLMTLSDTTVQLAKYKKWFVVNQMLEPSKWLVFPLQVVGDTMKMYQLPSDIEKFENRSFVQQKLKEDSSTYHQLSPTRKEFLQLIEDGFFGNPSNFIKVE